MYKYLGMKRIQNKLEYNRYTYYNKIVGREGGIKLDEDR